MPSKPCKCNKSPSFNFPGQSKPVCCAKCKQNGMIDVVSKKCNCGISTPSFNFEGESTAICCAKCKEPGMINVKHKRCKCGISIPCFNFDGESKPVCCSKCKEIGMIDIINKRCNCGISQPYFNFESESTAICCSKCKKDGMIDVIHKRCKGLLCPVVGNKKYRGYCTYCFAHMFPKDPLTFQIRWKTKEIAVRDFINANYEGFQHDKPLWLEGCDCTHRRRLDHRRLMNGTLLCVETDENQHKSYDQMDEEIRYNDISMIHGGKCIYIRFNPDKYININGIKKDPHLSTRLKTLKTEIDKQIERINNDDNTKLLEIVYLYYNDYT